MQHLSRSRRGGAYRWLLCALLWLPIRCSSDSAPKPTGPPPPVDYEELCKTGDNAYPIPFNFHLEDDRLAIHTAGGDLRVEISPSVSCWSPYRPPCGRAQA